MTMKWLPSSKGGKKDNSAKIKVAKHSSDQLQINMVKLIFRSLHSQVACVLGNLYAEISSDLHDIRSNRPINLSLDSFDKWLSLLSGTFDSFQSSNTFVVVVVPAK